MYWEDLIDSSNGPFIEAINQAQDLIMFDDSMSFKYSVPALDALINDQDFKALNGYTACKIT